ncbi:MerR family transcriptional regulator [Azospirillum isscasi]|uniref:Helix-turn-helix domain-containing protein n=1 Tax=Azospirillum isscasi TaxID=3053926 RepID=A0ABU0WFE2_9PROT|nr:hypothetical protein [Azospirillum isscasi]MDQ2102880.1 hypothetical protein [Azospirillum isscasi]
MRGESVPEGELAGAAAVHRLLHTPPDRLEGLAAQVGVGGVLALVYAFGGMASGDRRSRNAVSFARLHPERAHLLFDAGWRACADWPSSFHGLLERLRTRASERKGRYGIAKEFGRLHDWLSDIGDQTYGRVALKAFADHVAARPELATRALVALRRRAEAPPEHTGMTLMRAARLPNVAFETLRRLVDRHGLALAGGGGKGAPVLLRASVVRTLKAEMARLVDQDAAWHLFGMGKRTFVELRDTDLLPLPVPGADVLPPPAWALAADLFGRPVWAVADLETFVRRFDAAVVRRRGGGRLIGLPTVARMLSGLGLGMEQVLRVVLDGRLRPAALTAGKRGLARLAFRREDAVALQKAMAAEKRGTLSVNGAARTLGVKQEVAYQWVRRGLLPTVLVPGKRAETGRRVTTEAIDAFRERYVTASELRSAGALGRSRKLALDIIAMGVAPVCGPSVDGARQYLFPRAEVRDALSGASGRPE